MKFVLKVIPDLMQRIEILDMIDLAVGKHFASIFDALQDGFKARVFDPDLNI